MKMKINLKLCAALLRAWGKRILSASRANSIDIDRGNYGISIQYCSDDIQRGDLTAT